MNKHLLELAHHIPVMLYFSISLLYISLVLLFQIQPFIDWAFACFISMATELFPTFFNPFNCLKVDG